MLLLCKVGWCFAVTCDVLHDVYCHNLILLHSFKLMSCFRHPPSALQTELMIEGALHVPAFQAGACLERYRSLLDLNQAPDLTTPEAPSTLSASLIKRRSRPDAARPIRRATVAAFVDSLTVEDDGLRESAACLATPMEGVDEEAERLSNSYSRYVQYMRRLASGQR